MQAWLIHLALSTPHALLRRGRLDGNNLHRTLMGMVPDGLGKNARERAGLLFRTEPAPDGLHLLAQTRVPPNIEGLPPEFADNAQQRELTPLLDGLTSGMRVRYRIAANPTKRLGNSEKQELQGKLRVLHGTDAELWWLRKATTAGLHPLEILASPAADVVGKTRHGVTVFDGTGIVTDPDLLRSAVVEGIGRAKTYGCGLLSIAPAGAAG